MPEMTSVVTWRSFDDDPPRDGHFPYRDILATDGDLNVWVCEACEAREFPTAWWSELPKPPLEGVE